MADFGLVNGKGMACLRTPDGRWLALLLVAVALSASGFVLEYGFDVLPCKMCWWQRYAHWGVAGLAGLGLLLEKSGWRAGTPGGRIGWRRPLAGLLLLVLLGGAAIAAWQFAAQHGWLPFPASCGGSGDALASGDDLLAAMQTTRIVPCDKENFTLLGLSLAGWNLVVTPLLLALVWPLVTRRG